MRKVREQFPHIPASIWATLSAKHSLEAALLQCIDDIEQDEGRGWIDGPSLLWPRGAFWPTTMRSLARKGLVELFGDTAKVRLTPLGRYTADGVRACDDARKHH